jgi:2'-5' RNA ligase
VLPVPEATPVLRTADGRERDGLPPHITVLYPFVRRGALSTRTVKSLAAALAPFPVSPFALTGLGRFPGVLYLTPEPADFFVAMTEAVVEWFPSCPPYGGVHPKVVPHVTVQEGSEQPDLAAALYRLLPVSCVARDVWLMAQGTGSWTRLWCHRLADPGSH